MSGDELAVRFKYAFDPKTMGRHSWGGWNGTRRSRLVHGKRGIAEGGDGVDDEAGLRPLPGEPAGFDAKQWVGVAPPAHS